MSHLLRVGLLLGLALVAFLTFRSLVLSDHVSVAEFGLRPVKKEANIRLWAGRALQYSEPKDCAGSGCHQDTYDVWATSAHGGASCESCHGPARAHGEDTEIPVPVDLDPSVCNLCHAQVMGRPEGFPEVEPLDHYPESTCTSCHLAHRPGPAQVVSHEVSEGSDCLSCHEASGPPDRAVPADHVGRTNDRCLTCHETRP